MFCVYGVGGGVELADCLAEGAGESGEAVGSEEQDHDGEDNEKFPGSDVHATSVTDAE